MAGIVGITAVKYASKKTLGKLEDAEDSAIALEAKMAEVKSKLDETGPNLKSTMDSLWEGVYKLSTQLGKGAPELAGGLNDILSAGVKPKDSLDVLGVAAKAAVAGATDTSTSAKFITKIMNAYKLPATDAGKISDSIFTTLKQGKMSFNELAGNMDGLLPIAAKLKIPIEDVFAAISTLKKAGTSAPDSAKALKGIFENLYNNADKYKAAGVDIPYAIQKGGLAGVLKKLEEIENGKNEKLKESLPSRTDLDVAKEIIDDKKLNGKYEQNETNIKTPAKSTDKAYKIMAGTLQHNEAIQDANLQEPINRANKSISDFLSSLNEGFFNSLQKLANFLLKVKGKINGLSISNIVEAAQDTKGKIQPESTLQPKASDAQKVEIKHSLKLSQLRDAINNGEVVLLDQKLIADVNKEINTAFSGLSNLISVNLNDLIKTFKDKLKDAGYAALTSSGLIQPESQPETKASGGLAQQGDVVGGGEFVMTRAANKSWGADFLASLNNFQMPAMPKMPELPDLKNGSLINGNTYLVDLHLPNDKSYSMQTTQEEFKKLATDFNFDKARYKIHGATLTFEEFFMKKFGW
ncbi:MAG: phage tail tape measure protein [Nitrospirae bacterium]|nr:phage tail tape measure protein [Nitrospirota bacterium]